MGLNMAKDRQTSAYSEGTRDLLERYARRTGIPPEYIIPPRIVVSADVLENLLQPVKPTTALRELMLDSDL